MLLTVNNQYTALLQQYGINPNNRAAATNTTFTDALSKAASGSTTTDSVLSELKGRFGAQIYVETLPNMRTESKNFQRQLDNLGSRTFGTNNIVIAPNILEKMANDPEAKQYYTQKIQEYFNSRPAAQSFMAAVGHQIISSGVIVHEDGTVTSWCNGDLTPKKKAEIERKMKAEDEAKAKKSTERKEQLAEAQANRAQAAKSAETWLNIKMLQAQLSANNAYSSQIVHSFNNIEAFKDSDNK